MINPVLLKMARSTVGKKRQKLAFQPPGGDPSQGGAPPMDPSMGGGQPPMDPSMMGGAPPPGMDPSMAGGAPPPPMDPSMMGGGGAPVPGAGGLTADSIRQIMQETLGQMGMVPGQAGPGGGAAGGKPGKPDLLAMSMDIFQIKKMMTTLFTTMGVPMPQDILDGPNRDPASGAPVPPGTPGSTSDPSKASPPAGGAGGGQQPSSAIQPISPIQGAFPASGGGGGGEKQSHLLGHEDRQTKQSRHIQDKASALSALLRSKSKL